MPGGAYISEKRDKGIIDQPRQDFIPHRAQEVERQQSGGGARNKNSAKPERFRREPFIQERYSSEGHEE